MARPVVFLSDYGLDDEFVGIVHRVIASDAPGVKVVDLNHRIRAHDVRAGSLALWRSGLWLKGSVVLAVVDPAVGTPRRPVALEVAGAGMTLVGPDNGLLTPLALAAGGVAAAVELRRVPRAAACLGSTFDGRDLFAPVAARLASGEWALTDAGDGIDPSTLLGEEPRMATVGADGVATCEVLWIDRFGNAQLNTRGEDMGDAVRVTAGGHRAVARRVAAFGDLASGEVGLVTDSYGLLALALNGASAASRLGLHEADVVVLSPAPPGGNRR